MPKQSDLDNIQGIRFAEVKNLSLNDKQWKNNPSYMADG